MKKIVVVAVVVAAALAAAYAGLAWHLKREITEQVNARLDYFKSRHNLDVSYGDIQVSLFDKSATLSQVTVRSGVTAIPVDTVTVFAVDDFDNAVNFEAKGIDLSGEKNKALDQGAYPPPDKADLRLDYAYVPAGRLADLRALNLTIANYFELTLSSKLIDPPSPAAAGNMLRFMVEAGDTQIVRAKIAYKDKGLLAYLFGDEAKKSGITAQAVADQYGADLDGRIAKYETLGSPEMVELLKAVKIFIRERKGIEVSLTPESPVKVNQIPQDEREAVKRLGLKAANR